MCPHIYVYTCLRIYDGARAKRPKLALPLLVLVLVLGLCAGSAPPLQLVDVCHPPGSTSVWVDAASGRLVACAGGIESDGTRALYVPDIGASIIVVIPRNVSVGVNASTASPRCLLQTDRSTKDLSPVIILSTYAVDGGMRTALLCPVPALSDASFPGGGGLPPESAKLFTVLDNAVTGSTFSPVDGLPLWFFGLSAPPLPTVTWAGGGALITLTGFNMVGPGAGGSRGDGGGGGTGAATAALTGATVGMTCRFFLAPNSNTTSYSAPWHLLLATGGALPLGATGRDSLAVKVTRNTTICQLPPMPQGFIPQQGSVLVSVSPDPYTIAFCAPRNLSLFTPIAASTSVARSSREGGFLLTITGRGFPPPSLPSSPPRVSFGSAIVSATFALENTLVCAVPPHPPGVVPLALSFDGQTFLRGEARPFYRSTVNLPFLLCCQAWCLS